MIKLLFIIHLILLATGFQIKDGIVQVSQVLKAKLPNFIGAGFHALKGNPYTDKIDEGFRYEIFQLTYSAGKTTEDGLYQIPDYSHSTQTFTCLLNPKISLLNGTQSYQKELSKLSIFDTRYDNLVMNARFSFSLAFKSFSEKIIKQNQVSIQANAECSTYTLEIPIYSNEMKLTNDFIQAVRQGYVTNRWEDFLQNFGSHYVTSVVYGARYFLQHTYSEESISLFKSLKLDLSMSAKAQFMTNLGISLTDQLKKYTNQTRVINNNILTQTNSIIGAIPPASGNQSIWIDMAKLIPAPISYKLSAITILFNYVPGINATKANLSFSDFFNNYCIGYSCPKIIPDRPDPKPLEIVLLKGEQIEGKNKSITKFDTNDGKIAVGMRVAKILLGFQNNLQSFQFILSDGIIQHALPRIGTTTPMKHQYQIEYGDDLKCIIFGIHAAIAVPGNIRFSSLQFKTKSGLSSDIYSGDTTPEQFRSLCVSNNQEHILGLYGRVFTEKGAWQYDSIGLNLMKEVFK